LSSFPHLVYEYLCMEPVKIPMCVLCFHSPQQEEGPERPISFFYSTNCILRFFKKCFCCIAVNQTRSNTAVVTNRGRTAVQYMIIVYLDKLSNPALSKWYQWFYNIGNHHLEMYILYCTMYLHIYERIYIFM
jgi:hypothetical protein